MWGLVRPFPNLTTCQHETGKGGRKPGPGPPLEAFGADEADNVPQVPAQPPVIVGAQPSAEKQFTGHAACSPQKFLKFFQFE